MDSTQWKEVNIVIDEKIEAVFKEIQSIEADAYIAGGYICDLYLGTPYNDVDIFIPHSNSSKRRTIEKMRKMGFSSKTLRRIQYLDEADVFEFEKEDQKYQLIFTQKGLRKMDDFDIRFRKMYYQNGKAYAHKEALQDIKDKKLVFQFVHDPLQSLLRYVRFHKKYGFQYDLNNMEYFKVIFNNKQYRKWKVIDFVLQEKSWEIKKELFHFLTKNQEWISKSVFWTLQHCISYKERIQLNSFAPYLEPFIKSNMEYKEIVIDENVFEKLEEESKQTFKNFQHKERLHWTFEKSEEFQKIITTTMNMYSEKDVIFSRKDQEKVREEIRTLKGEEKREMSRIFDSAFTTIMKFRKKKKQFKKEIKIYEIDGKKSFRATFYAREKNINIESLKEFFVENNGYIVWDCEKGTDVMTNIEKKLIEKIKKCL